jgi:hypothetical protein
LPVERVPSSKSISSCRQCSSTSMTMKNEIAARAETKKQMEKEASQAVK